MSPATDYDSSTYGKPGSVTSMISLHTCCGRLRPREIVEAGVIVPSVLEAAILACSLTRSTLRITDRVIRRPLIRASKGTSEL